MGSSIPFNSCRTTVCCSPVPSTGCLVILYGECVRYSGSNIAGPNINVGDTFNTVVNKLVNYGTSSYTGEDGVTVSSAVVKLGQSVGEAGNPATLSEDREIPMNENDLNLINGPLRLTRNNSIGGGNTYPLVVENTTLGGVWLADFRGDVGEIHVRTTAPVGFPAYVSMIFYDGENDPGNLKMSIGYDRPSDHAFMCDVRNTGMATWEAYGDTLGGFFTTSYNFFMGSATQPDARLAVNALGEINATHAAVFENGNVGISTPNPTKTLDVRGEVNILSAANTDVVHIETTEPVSGAILQVVCEFDPIKVKCLTAAGFPDIAFYDHNDVLRGTMGAGISTNELFMDARNGGGVTFRINGGAALAISSTSLVTIVNTPEFADNAAAITGGLTVGEIYRTGDDLKIVH